MITVEIKNLEKAFSTIDKWLSDVEHLAESAAKGLIYYAFDYVTEKSPQYSGDFVANWKLSFARPDLSFHAGIFPEKTFPVPEGDVPFQRGDIPAILYAVNQSTGKLDGFRLGQTLWLANSAHHDDLVENTYAWMIEGNLIKFRPQNVWGDAPIRKAKEEILMYYPRITQQNMRHIIRHL